MAVESSAEILVAKVALIGALGVGAQWLAWRLQWPAIVLMSVAGLIVGPLAALAFGDPLLSPQDDFGELFRPMVALAVAVILFEGGLALEFRELQGAGKAVRRLVFPGAAIAWVLGALAARYVGGLDWDIAALMGGLFVVTGPTVILPLLRQSKLSGRAAALLKWEGIVNDPVGALLAVLVFEVVRFTSAGLGWFQAVGWLVMGALFGAGLGVAAGMALAFVFRRGQVPEFLKAPVVFASVLACFALAEAMAPETGLVAVTAFGMAVANARLASIDEMRRFKETIATLLVSGVFVMLTATLTIDSLAALDWRHGAFIAAMLVVVRPVTVWLSTMGTGLNWRERALVGWIAPRGIVAVAVAGFFAAELAALDPARADAAALTPLAFALVFATVILHGFSITPLAKRLGLAATGPEGVLIVGANPWSLGLAKAIQALELPVTVADTNWLRLRRARLDGVATFFGEVLSEAADHRLDHTKYGWLIAASSNDAYNALVSIEFAPELGRHRVYQLAGGEAERERDRAIAHTARGRTLARPGRGFDALASDWWRGWRFRATKLTEEYTLQRFLDERGPDVDLVLEKRADGRVQLLGPDIRPRGGAGATLLWFAPPKSEEPASEPAPTEGGEGEEGDAASV